MRRKLEYIYIIGALVLLVVCFFLKKCFSSNLILSET